MSPQSFTAPKLGLKSTVLAEIPFEGNVNAGAYLTLVSGRVPYRFRVLRAKMFFTAAAANLVQHRWFVSRNSNAEIGAWPADTNLYGQLSPTATFVGQSLIRQVETSVQVDEEGLYIKLATYNGSGAAYHVNGSITIQEIR